MRRQRLAKKHTPVDKSVLAFGEPERLRDKLYRDDARNRVCLACDLLGRVAEPGSVVLAHISLFGSAGKGLKAGDDVSIDLCFAHHSDFDGSDDRAGWLAKHIVIPWRKREYKRWQARQQRRAG